MKPATQKPDTNTPEIRTMLRDLQGRGWLRYIEPPSGFGCDFVILMRGRVIFAEVKTHKGRNRFTRQEVLLREMCKETDNEYIVITSQDELLEVINA